MQVRPSKPLALETVSSLSGSVTISTLLPVFFSHSWTNGTS